MRLSLRVGACAALVLMLAGAAFAQVGPPVRIPGQPAPQQVRPQGQPSIAAPLGPSGDGLYVSSADRIPLRNTDTRVVGLNLPRGAYQIIGHVVFANDRNDNGAVACALRTSTGELDYISTSVPPNTRDEHTLLGAVDVGGPLQGGISVSCSSTSNVAVTIRWARLQAVTVSHITGQIAPPPR